MSILTRTGERAKHSHLLGLLEGVRAASLKSKVLSFIHAMLVGETLLQADDIGAKVRELLGGREGEDR